MSPVEMEPELRLTVNGAEHRLAAGRATRLLDVLRDTLGLRSVREGCGMGMCGACTVLIEGRVVSSCLLLAAQAEGRPITTVEGLGEELHPIQQAFIEHAAFQCAYCTPGFVLAVEALLREQPRASEAEIREYLAGNLCRCGSYANILAAVRALQGRLAAEECQ